MHPRGVRFRWICLIGSASLSVASCDASPPLDRPPVEALASGGEAGASVPVSPVVAADRTTEHHGPRVHLMLALRNGAHYRATTVGMTTFALVGKPMGFAREEELRIFDCERQGAQRNCVLEHRFRNFDAELPLGKALKIGEAKVAPLVSSHRINAQGERLGTTKVSAPEGLSTGAEAMALRGTHRMFCLSFPDQPVAVGETWPSSCRLYVGGQVQQRTVTWRLQALEDDPEVGQKAVLTMSGDVSTADPKIPGKRRGGSIAGKLYFLVDKGEPFSLRQKIHLQSPAGNGLNTEMDLHTQFVEIVPAESASSQPVVGVAEPAPQSSFAAPKN